MSVTENNDIKIGGYVAKNRGDHYTIMGRGVIIGCLDRREEQWLASRSTLDRGRAQQDARDADPREAMRAFLQVEGWSVPALAEVD